MKVWSHKPNGMPVKVAGRQPLSSVLDPVGRTALLLALLLTASSAQAQDFDLHAALRGTSQLRDGSASRIASVPNAGDSGRFIRPALVILSALIASDSATTHIGLSLGGREGNPIRSAYVLDVLHGAAVVGWWKVAPKSDREAKGLTRGVLIVAIAFEGFIVAHNVQQIQLQRRYNREAR